MNRFLDLPQSDTDLIFPIGTMLTNEHGLLWEVVGYYQDDVYYTSAEYRLKQHPPKIDDSLSRDWFVFGPDMIEKRFWPLSENGKLLYGKV